MRTRVLGFVLLLSMHPLLAETMDVRITNRRLDSGYFKFDVEIKATDDWTAGETEDGGLGDTDFYFTYTEDAFTGSPTLSSVTSNLSDYPDDYTVSIAEVNPPGYILVKIELGGDPVWKPVVDTWEFVCTVSWQINDPGKTSGVEWDQTNTGAVDGDGEAITIVNWESSGDISLPVRMSSLTAEPEGSDGIRIAWKTESESHAAGFHVWRSRIEKDKYERLTTAPIPNQGGSSEGFEYSYSDRNVEQGVVYWYRIESLSTDGESSYHGPVSAIGVQAVPAEYGLSQNYPNPFNPQTAFRYELPEAADVRIVVYSLLGQQIKLLVQERKPAGYHTADWDATDETGQKVPSGIYLLRMQAGKKTLIRKMTVLR